MKSLNALCAASVFVSILGSDASHADYSSSAIHGPVTCFTKGITVTINPDRTSFTVTQTREPAVFNVVDRSEGDRGSYISFTGQLQLDHQKDEAVLTLSNLGDSLEIGGKTRSLKCP